MPATDPTVPDVKPSSKRFGWWCWSLTLKGYVLEGEAPTKALAYHAAAAALREWQEAGDTAILDLDKPPM